MDERSLAGEAPRVCGSEPGEKNGRRHVSAKSGGGAVERAVQAVAQQLKSAPTRSRCLTALEALPGVDAEVSRALRGGLRRRTRTAR